MESILAGDIGGTNTRLILYKVKSDEASLSQPLLTERIAPGNLICRKEYANENYTCFIDIVKAFLMESGIQKPPITCCLAVAGPVKSNSVKFTNREDWEINGDQIGQELGIKVVRLINDFLGVGYGLLTLNKSTECKVLQEGVLRKDAPIACIGAGTGLGECFLTPDSDGQYLCFPCEGGHADYCPRSELEVGLLNYLKEKFDQPHRVSVERVVSGSGLVNIYEFMCKTFPAEVNAEIWNEFEAAGDLKGAVIARNQKRDRLCSETMKIFIESYGAEAGTAGLKWLPYGGLFLAGGLTPKNIDAIEPRDGMFMTAFRDKGRVSGMLTGIPVYAVMTDDLGERGAHLVAYKDLQQLAKSLVNRSTSNNYGAVFGAEKSASTHPPTSSDESRRLLYAGAVLVAATAVVLSTLRK